MSAKSYHCQLIEHVAVDAIRCKKTHVMQQTDIVQPEASVEVRCDFQFWSHEAEICGSGDVHGGKLADVNEHLFQVDLVGDVEFLERVTRGKCDLYKFVIGYTCLVSL